MSTIAAITATLVSSRASCHAALSRLGSVWRDSHFTVFRDQFAAPADTATLRLIAALERADDTVDTVFRGLRNLGCDP
jgi:hypothetical protein